MAANVESMFFVRETPWHGLGTRVMEAPTSKEALRLAGLDWKVIQEPILTTRNEIIPGFKANIRDKDHRVLGVVTDRYKIIQNDEAFAFTDALLGAGVRYETAGSLQNGRRVWLLAERVYHHGRAYQPVSALQQHSRWLRCYQGMPDANPCCLQQYAEPCPQYGTAQLVYDPYGRRECQDGGSL